MGKYDDILLCVMVHNEKGIPKDAHEMCVENIIDGKRTFTVWPRANRFLPGIEFHTGIADSLADAVHQLKESLPEVFPIDDEFSVCSKSLDFEVVRPFDMVKSYSIRQFNPR